MNVRDKTFVVVVLKQLKTTINCTSLLRNRKHIFHNNLLLNPSDSFELRYYR